MTIENALRKRLQALAKGKVTVAEVVEWICQHFVAVPEVSLDMIEIPDVPEIPEIPPLYVDDIDVDDGDSGEDRPSGEEEADRE